MAVRVPLIAQQRDCLLNPVYADNLNPVRGLFWLVQIRDKELPESYLCGFLDAFLAALDRTNFAGQSHLTEDQRFRGQRSVSQG